MDKQNKQIVPKKRTPKQSLFAGSPLLRRGGPNAPKSPKNAPLKDATNQISPQAKQKPVLQHLGNVDFPYEVNKIYDDTRFDRYASSQFVINQDGIIDAMNKAAERGANIDLTVGAHTSNRTANFKGSNVKRDIKEHGKITVALEGSPAKKGAPAKTDKAGVVMVGSNNSTNATWKNVFGKPIKHNLETAIKVEDRELAEQAYYMIISDSPMKKKKEIVEITPEKTSLYSSKKTDLIELEARRLFTLAEDKNSERFAYLRTMNLNNERFVDGAIAAKKSGADVKLIANHTALTKPGTPLLEKLNDAGVDVHIFYPGKNYRAIQHSKEDIIGKGSKRIVLENTGNKTHENNDQRNFTLLTLNPEIAKSAVQNFEQVQAISKPLSDALKLKEKQKKAAAEKKAEKRKAEKALKEQPAKKQKK